MWTRFFDMASGGTSKTDYNVIYIELPKQEAIEYFENRFNTHPYNVTCSCCGEDFSVREAEDPIYDNSNLVITKQEIDNDNIQV